MNRAALVLLLLFAADQAAARSSAQRAAFARANPCPSTGEPRGACPGWVVDHIEPLCAGGADHPSNMQWQELYASRSKDIVERARCRSSNRKDKA